MSLYSEQSKNIQKTWLLIAIFSLITIGIGWIIGYVINEPFILYIAVVIAFIQTAIAYWQSDKIALASVRAKPITREEYFDLWNAVENLSITAGISMPRVYVIHDPVPNAFATGRNEKHAAVAVTSGLLSLLDRAEFEGVIAHELAHIKNRDILVASMVVVLVGVWALLSDMMLRLTIFRGSDDRNSNNALALVGVVFVMLSPILGMMIQLAISRKREFLADASGALLTRYPEGLARALEKIHAHAGKMKYANGATAHLFISNPFGKKEDSKQARFWSKLFMTHPPVEERIRALSNTGQR